MGPDLQNPQKQKSANEFQTALEVVCTVGDEIWSWSIRSDANLQLIATDLQYLQLQNPDLLTACSDRSCSDL
jgi:hypothetical protein